MKNLSNTKATVIGASLVVLGLWAGYALGYHRGVRDEQRKWWSSARLDEQGNLVYSGPPAELGFDAVYTIWNPISGNLGK